MSSLVLRVKAVSKITTALKNVIEKAIDFIAEIKEAYDDFCTAAERDYNAYFGIGIEVNNSDNCVIPRGSEDRFCGRFLANKELLTNFRWEEPIPAKEEKEPVIEPVTEEELDQLTEDLVEEEAEKYVPKKYYIGIREVTETVYRRYLNNLSYSEMFSILYDKIKEAGYALQDFKTEINSAKRGSVEYEMNCYKAMILELI